MRDVWPIFMTDTDWQTFIQQCVSVAGFNPTSAILVARESVEGPAALLKSLEAFGGDIRHVHMGFLMQLQEGEALKLATRGDLIVTVHPSNLAVASGNLLQWAEAFRRLCNPLGLIDLFNTLYFYFEQVGLMKYMGLEKIDQLNQPFMVK